jgi:hypothetical protein
MSRNGKAWCRMAETLHQDRSFHHHGHRLPHHTDDKYKAILKNGIKHNPRYPIYAMRVTGIKVGIDLGHPTILQMQRNHIFFVKR